MLERVKFLEKILLPRKTLDIFPSQVGAVLKILSTPKCMWRTGEGGGGKGLRRWAVFPQETFCCGAPKKPPKITSPSAPLGLCQVLVQVKNNSNFPLLQYDR